MKTLKLSLLVGMVALTVSCTKNKPADEAAAPAANEATAPAADGAAPADAGVAAEPTPAAQ